MATRNCMTNILKRGDWFLKAYKNSKNNSLIDPIRLLGTLVLLNLLKHSVMIRKSEIRSNKAKVMPNT